jgi:hypothetical protein
MKSYLVRLKEKEWSMGNGQCPSCGGLAPGWYKKDGFSSDIRDPKMIGHRKFCILARMLKDYGGTPIILGKFAPTTEDVVERRG